MNIIIINIVCYLIFPILVLWKAEYLKNSWNEAVLTKDDSAAMRGIAALFVVFAHYLYYLNEHGINRMGPAKLMQWCGGLGVCVFFFASGYGLWMSYQNKGVDRSYLYNRFKNLIPVIIILRLIFGLTSGITRKGALYFLLYIFNLKEPLWFVSEIVLVYIIYYVAMKISKKHSIKLVSCMLVIMSIIFYLLGFEARWYNANLVFAAGLLSAKYRKNLLDFFKKQYFLKLSSLIILFGICAIGFSTFKGDVWANILKLIAGAIFSICIFCILMKLRIHSRLLLIIGRSSLQIYIIHLGVRDIWAGAFGENYLLLQFIGGIITSVILTVIYYFTDLQIKSAGL